MAFYKVKLLILRVLMFLYSDLGMGKTKKGSVGKI